jgi:hypothetical protein
VFFYRAYGQILASDFPFPELRATDPGLPAWSVRDGGVLDRRDTTTAVVLGSEPLYGNYTATLFQVPTGLRVVVDGTGEFDLSADGRTITAYRYPAGSADFLRAHLLGRVMATGFHTEGHLVLHGSAVSYPVGAIAILAPKHTGKTTLALTLTRAGARLMSDDTLPVRMGEEPLVLPGIHSMRLQEDSARHFVGGLPSEARPDGKYVFNDLAEEQLEHGIRPLKAVYLLVAAERIAEGGPVARRQLMPPAAAAALVGMGKIPLMLGGAQGAELLRRAVQVVSRVPVYHLMVVRDMAALPEVARQMAAWHGEAVA